MVGSKYCGCQNMHGIYVESKRETPGLKHYVHLEFTSNLFAIIFISLSSTKVFFYNWNITLNYWFIYKITKFFWSVFSLIQTEGVSFRIQSECGKISTRKSPNTDTFRAVSISVLIVWISWVSECPSLCTITYIETYLQFIANHHQHLQKYFYNWNIILNCRFIIYKINICFNYSNFMSYWEPFFLPKVGRSEAKLYSKKTIEADLEESEKH